MPLCRTYRLRHAARIMARAVAAAAALTAVATLTAGCTSPPATINGKIAAVGAENQYANVISQIGGRYVSVFAVMSDPNTDPHAFEASPRVAAAVYAARLVVQNGLGYDGFMTKLEQSAASPGRTVIDVQHLLGLPDNTANPHLWYKPSIMPVVAAAIAADLAGIQPAHKAYFAANLAAFDTSLTTVTSALSTLRARYDGAPVATTEPVADYLFQAAGLDNMTPWTFQADIMNGTDPSPQDTAAQQALLTGRKVAVFVYNQQVTDPMTQSLLALAKQNRVPVVAVYETMPTPGYDYQQWMLAETAALSNALAHKWSAPTL